MSGVVRALPKAGLLALLLSLVSPALAQTAADEATLRAETQALLDAVAPGEVAVWAARLHDNYTNMDETGTVRTRPAFLDVLRPLPAGLEGRMEIEQFRVAFEGETAVVTYEIQEYLDYHGQPLRSRFRSMDIWQRSGDDWRLLAQHVAAILKDPPSVALGESALCAYAGEYALTDAIRTQIRCTSDSLIASRANRPDASYLAEASDIFFVPGQPRTRRIFQRGPDGEISAFVDRREGEDIRWRRIGPLSAE